MIKRGKMNRKGLQIMIETYIIIILAILVAVVLIIMWDFETGKFSSYVKELMGKSNIDSVTAACNSLVARSAVYEYCCAEKDIKYEVDKEIREESMTCEKLAEAEFGSRVEKMDCKGAGCQEK